MSAYGKHGHRGDYRRNICDLIRYLVLGPKTAAQLFELVDFCEPSLRGALLIAEECGLVYRAGSGGPAGPFVYHWCPVPFEVPETARAAA